MVPQTENLSIVNDVQVLQGNCGTVEIALGVTTMVNVAPRAVATIIANPLGEEASLIMIVGDGAGVHLIFPKIPATASVTIDAGSNAHVTLSFVGELSGKHTVASHVSLIGEGAQAHVQVAVVGAAGSEAELTCTLEHIAKATFARMLVRRVQTGSSFSTLKGMLKVAAEAHSTDTYLSDKALLLGDRARAISEPGLEILADDVKASHGATIGRMSAEELFYLRSRGLPEVEATRLLARAFLEPALVGIPADVVLGLEQSLSTYATLQPA